MPFSLYLHLPFCRRKCPYCDFYKKVPKSGERELFLKALLSEMDLAATKIQWLNGGAQTIYFGGGTPSLHPSEEIAQVLTRASELWGIANTAEITLEVNPGTVTLDCLRKFKSFGINRLSIGVQSFSQRKLGLLYRDHTVSDSLQCENDARSAGFENLSLDLIFGIPGESIAEWRNDLDSALKLDPEHISLYNLEFHDGTPYENWRKSGRLKPLEEDSEADMYLLAHDVLTAKGFEHYEVSNYSRPGFRAVHNSAYWQQKAYLGLGPSAHSFDGVNLRTENVADLTAYLSAVWVSNLPISTQTRNSEIEQQEEWVSLSLRLRDGIAYNNAILNIGAQKAQDLWRRAAALPEHLRTLTDSNFGLTPQGWFKENSVMLHLLEFVN
jgi:oxygen-independent coproporphyrinogen-3 oxidase